MLREYAIVVFLLSACGGTSPPAAESHAVQSGSRAPAPPSSPPSATDPVLASLETIAGEYTGEWTLRGVDETGAPKVVMSWTDEVSVPFEPIREPGRAYLSVTDEMTFEGPVPARTVTFKEGFLVADDGSVGERFFNQGDGGAVVETELAPGVYTFSQVATPEELATLGFTDANPGTHVTVKTTTRDGSVEQEHISRVTTAQWRDADGRPHTTQMVTLEGMHRRSADHS